MRPVPHLDMEDVVELLNEFSSATRAEAGEGSDPYPRLTLLTRLKSSETEAVRVADRVFSVLNHRQDARSSVIEDLNQLAEAAEIIHRLGNQGRLTWYQRGYSDPLAGAVVAALLDFADEIGLSHVGFCSADRCVDIYVDRSRGRQRRYCSDRCGARSRVSNWRARQRPS